LLIGKINMVSTLKKTIVPLLKEQGFKGSFPHFRRITEKKIHLLTFQFDKYGGGFLMEVGVCPPDGYRKSKSEIIPPNKVTCYHLQNRARITNNGDWFRYDKENNIGNIYEDVANEVISTIKEAETYWAKMGNSY